MSVARSERYAAEICLLAGEHQHRRATNSPVPRVTLQARVVCVTQPAGAFCVTIHGTGHWERAAVDARRTKEVRVALEERRDALASVANTGREAAATVELDQARVGRVTRMDALQAQAMARETTRRRAVELQRITAALERLRRGDYGYCLACEEPIAPERLRIDPAAPLCIRCAQRAGASETAV